MGCCCFSSVFPIQKTDPLAQHAELPLTAAARQLFGGLADTTWASTLTSARVAIIHCLVQHVTSVSAARCGELPPSLTAPFSLDKTLDKTSASPPSAEEHEHCVLLLLSALYLPHSCTISVLLRQQSAPELLQRPAHCHHMLSVL